LLASCTLLSRGSARNRSLFSNDSFVTLFSARAECMWCVRVCSNSVAATPLKSSSFAHQPLACTTAPSLWCALIATATSLRDYNRHRVELSTLTQCARSRYARACHDYSQHTHPVRAHRSLSHPLTRTRRTHTYTRFRASFPGDEVLHVRELSEAATVSIDAGGAAVVDSVSSSTAHGWTPERRDRLLSELAALLVSGYPSSRMMCRRCFRACGQLRVHVSDVSYV
jgi:hypothetical protein